MKKDSTGGLRFRLFSAVARPPQRFWANRVRVQRASKLNAILPRRCCIFAGLGAEAVL